MDFDYLSLNEIETLFYDAWVDCLHEDLQNEVEKPIGVFSLLGQQVVGIYKVDFLYGPCAVEIDGHQYHHTKEQREKDYKKTRYLTKQGYTVVRFMGTEVYLDATKCVRELDEIACMIEKSKFDTFMDGVKSNEKKRD